jgi:hypothetical protein
MDSRARKLLLLAAMHLLLPVAILATVLSTCRRAASVPVWKTLHDSGWKALESGLEVREASLSYGPRAEAGNDTRRVKLTALRSDPRRFRLEALPRLASGEGDALKAARAAGAAAALSGPGPRPDGSGPGLLISGSKLLAGRNPDLHFSAVFLLDDRGRAKAGLLHEVQPPYSNVEFAVQSRPLLVRGGTTRASAPGRPPDSAPNGRFSGRRTAIGVDRSGRVVMLFCEGPVGPAELNVLLATAESRGGFGLSSALRLSAGPNATMALVHEASGTLRHLPGRGAAPRLILLRRRRTPIAPERDRPPGETPPGGFVPVRPGRP